MSYSDECFGRLLALLGDFADTQEEADALRAELTAYSQELGMIAENTETAMEQAFPTYCSEETLDAFCRALGISLSLSAEDRRDLVGQAFRQEFAPFGWQEFLAKAAELDPELEASISDFSLSLIPFGGDIMPILGDLTRLVDAYIPPCVLVGSASGGRTFAQWDALDMTFGELDSMGLHYNLIETL